MIEEIKQIFIDDPYASVIEASRKLGLSRHYVSKLANSVRSLEHIPAKTAINIVPKNFTGKTRLCLKCRQEFVVTENYYRCPFCRSRYK